MSKLYEYWQDWREWFVNSWRIKKAQILGAGFILMAVLSFYSGILADLSTWIWLGGAGLLTLYAVYIKKQQSVSSWIGGLFPWPVDLALMIGLVVAALLLPHLGNQVAQGIALGAVGMHLAEQGRRE